MNIPRDGFTLEEFNALMQEEIDQRYRREQKGGKYFCRQCRHAVSATTLTVAVCAPPLGARESQLLRTEKVPFLHCPHCESDVDVVARDECEVLVYESAADLVSVG